MRAWRLVLSVAAITLVILRPQAAVTQPKVSQFLKPGMPVELVSARKVDRLAWIAYEEGRRNVYTAAGPEFKPVRLTNVTKEDGADVTDIRISDDGSTVAWVRGTAPNRQGWVANPTSDPDGAERAIWAVRVTPTPGAPARLAPGAGPIVSPDGRSVLYVK